VAKWVSGAEATATFGALTPEQIERFMYAFGSWAKAGAQKAGRFAAASADLERPLTAEDVATIKAKLTAWFQTQPDPADFVEQP
jgi:hypothetical protein